MKPHVDLTEDQNLQIATAIAEFNLAVNKLADFDIDVAVLMHKVHDEGECSGTCVFTGVGTLQAILMVEQARTLLMHHMAGVALDDEGTTVSSMDLIDTTKH